MTSSTASFETLPLEILGQILDLTVRHALISKTCQRAINLQIQKIWGEFLNSPKSEAQILINKCVERHITPNTGLPIPSSISDLCKIYVFLMRKGKALGQRLFGLDLKPTYIPTDFMQIERRVWEAENAFCLMQIWPRLIKVMPPTVQEQAPEYGDAQEISQWLKDNKDVFADVVSLDLSESRITRLPDEFLQLSLPRLKVLNLSYNQLSVLPHNFLADAKKLKKLELVGNKLRSLPEDFGLQWTRLRLLNISCNPIQELPTDFGSTWINLQNLYLHDTGLEQLEDQFGDCWPNIKEVKLKNNCLKCLPPIIKSWLGKIIIDLELLDLASFKEMIPPQ
jgi:hypothetical protein